MANLDNILNVKGVFAAGEFADDGSLTAFKGGLSEEFAAMAAQMCAANNGTARVQCDGYTAFSGEEWTPMRGWALSGPTVSICVMGNVGAFMHTEEASFNEVFKALMS